MLTVQVIGKEAIIFRELLEKCDPSKTYLVPDSFPVESCRQTLNLDIPLSHNHFESRRCYPIPLSNNLMVPLITTSYGGG